MKEKIECGFAAGWKDGAPGTFKLIRHGASESPDPILTDHFSPHADGKGMIESFSLYEGIELSFQRYMADQVRFHHEANNAILEINYCRRGRMGWRMGSGATVYLGAGDLCLHSLASCADSVITLPLGFYEGVAVTVDLQKMGEHCPSILREAGFHSQAIHQKFCMAGAPIGIPSNALMDSVFSPLYELPEDLRIPYYKLKVQEILLRLLAFEPEREKALTPYEAQQTALIKEIRDFLVQHLDQRYTIEDLAKKYLLNTSSLKTLFKAVYGMPLASYVKEYRMQQAMKLLRDTSDSIATIAEKVGYESQGKFTKAFKEKVHLLPSEYRKLYCQ